MNSFGIKYRLTTFGESHGLCVGGIIDGCPAGLVLDFIRIQEELALRSPQNTFGATSRMESDDIQFYSGLLDGVTTGAPVAFSVINNAVRSADYDKLRHVYRPGHADFTYQMKYGIRDYRGGGRASARETVSRVVAGAIAKQWLAERGVKIQGFVSRIGNVVLDKSYGCSHSAEIRKSALRCPDTAVESEMRAVIDDARERGDSVGGVVSCVISGVPIGIGEPIYGKLDAYLAFAMLSIPASKGFDIGRGMDAAFMYGSENNDQMVVKDGEVSFLTNNAGGVLGGIATGQDIVFRVAFKPVSSIAKEQMSVDDNGRSVMLNIGGRHDVCIAPRAVAVVEAMAAITVMDQILLSSRDK